MKKSTITQEMRAAAGYRERYAMENGNRSVIYINGEKCYKFTYSALRKYQDANGATYNTIQKRWID